MTIIHTVTYTQRAVDGALVEQTARLIRSHHLTLVRCQQILRKQHQTLNLFVVRVEAMIEAR